MARDMSEHKRMQVFYMAREPSACPLIPEIVKTCRTIATIPSLKNAAVVFSMRYGKRLLINGDSKKPMDLIPNDFLEIVDYDPVKQVTMVMGALPPPACTPLHWLLQQARRDINAILQCMDITLPSHLESSFTTVKDLDSLGYLDLARTILSPLRDRNSILINSQGILTIGTSLADVEQTLRSLFG
jgi:hypothetical protein